MGLYIQSLAGIPGAKRSYYIYLLDYGWTEPLGDALFNNFPKMAEIASENDAVVIRGAGSRVHFNINGEDGDKILPAILVTNRHPHEFKESFNGPDGNINKDDYKIIIFPLKKYCKTTTDVAVYIDKIFKDIVAKKDLSDFRIIKEMKGGLGKALVDGILLEPNLAGFGFNLKPILEYFNER
jgi:hypothetical protein